MTPTTYTTTLDYLAGTVSADLPVLLAALENHYGGKRQRIKGRNGYTDGYAIQTGEEAVCEVHHRQDENPWTFATGWRSQALHDFLRGSGMGWYVTRMDSALDVFDSSLFPVLVDAAKRWALDHDMVTNVAGDWIGCARGRTFYLGSRASRCFHRIYEKGRKERTDPNWIRCELEYKPQSKDERFSATVLSAPQLWAMHAGPVFGECLGLDLGEVFQSSPTLRPKRDHDRSCRALASQYGRTIERWMHDVGGDPVAFVAELLAAVEHQRSVRAWTTAPDPLYPELVKPQ
jgi:Replication initiation factor